MKLKKTTFDIQVSTTGTVHRATCTVGNLSVSCTGPSKRAAGQALRGHLSLLGLKDARPRRGHYRWTVEIQVDAVWVADGFEMTDDRIERMLMNELSSATEYEVAGRVLTAPDPDRIAREQGYKSAADKQYLNSVEWPK